ncbi:MAG: hypothetical protein JSS12_02385, partial [Verrucomicrobia bacterium]|nr:hypothetical protein [Verrucomicrobiota bacterium]
MDPTKFAPHPSEIPEEGKQGKTVGKEGARTVRIGSKGSVLAKGRLEQTIQATPKEAAPLTSSHTISKELDPKTHFRELGAKSKKAFEGQAVLDPKRDKFHAEFSDMPCIRETAIQVGNRFLHANRVTLNEIPFIACSAPQNRDRELFWHAVFENADSIVDVSGLGEVEGYFPEEEGKKMVFGKMIITCQSAGPPHVYSINDGQKEKTVTRMHFSKWPDHGVITVSQLESLVHGYKTYCNHGTALFHCRAGVGRTGTMMVAVAIRDLYDKGLLTPENAVKTVEALVLDARRQRGPATVQVDDQLRLLCNYAKKLASEGPETHFDLQNTLTDPRKISTLEQALELVKKIRDNRAGPEEQNSFSSALKIIAEALQSNPTIDKVELANDLKAIRESNVSNQDVVRGYSVVHFDESTEEEIPHSRDLTIPEKNMLDFTQMLLETKVPQEVLEHEGYTGTALFNLGSTGIDRMHLPAEKIRSQALANTALFLKGAHSLQPGKLHYMFTPSTSTTGPQGYEPFTLRFITAEGKIGNARFVKSPQGWQELREDQRGRPDYAALAAARSFTTLDGLLAHFLKDKETAAVTKDAAMQQKQVIIGSESMQVPDLLLRGLCETSELQAQEVAADEPFIIPASFSEELVHSCFDTLLFGIPLQAPLQDAGLLADFLMCSKLKQEVSLQETQQPSKEYTITPSNQKRLEMQLSMNSRQYAIEIDAKGAFKVKDSDVTYPTLAKLVRDIKQAELLRTALENQRSLAFEANPRGFPMRPFLVESRPLSLAIDGTFAFGEEKGLKTLEEVKTVSQGRFQKLNELRTRLLRLPAFVPGATLEQAKELLKGCPDGTFLLRHNGPDDIRVVYIDAPEFQEAAVEVLPNGFRIRAEHDRFGA